MTKKIKNSILIITLLNTNNLIFAQRKRFHDLEEPLLKVNWEYTGVGFLLLVAGYLWILPSKNNETKNSGTGGCLLMIVGIILLFPLITWICAGINALIGIGYLIGIIAFLIFGVYSIFKK